ncbi:hypothetical protein AURDEDRAFT_177198 [Auricularia subglabra TFB-10046 SS5]|uniref:Uncharacterized protein n=1 Tax=Auricularia subglabra (strain TFB-10046 / SS5) TaxID=717982 RepID=J0LB97_AURST|nr:hypothetical protein AURDEDRAFT_177198 [Auricularia subglabra TFB-10046 SS5]
MPPLDHPDWMPMEPRPAGATAGPKATSWVRVRRPRTPSSVGPASSRSVSPAETAPGQPQLQLPLPVQAPPATPPPVSPSPSLSSPEHDTDAVYRPSWLQTLEGVLDLPVSDRRLGQQTQFCVAGVDMHIPHITSEDEGDEPIDPEEFLFPRFTPGKPLSLKILADFAALRTEYDLSLAYEEHAAIRAADAAALFKSKAPNRRDAGGLHCFFLPTQAERALVFRWRTADALSAITLNDRQTDSVTIMLSVRPEFDGLVLDGNMLDITVYIAESLLDDNGLPHARYAAAVDDIITTFRHRIAVRHARDFVCRLRKSSRVDFPRIARPGLSPAAAATLRRDRQPTGASRPPSPRPCDACTAQSKQPEPTTRPTCCACRSKPRIIPRLPGTLTAQLWQPEHAAGIVAALKAAQDSMDTMYATLRSLDVCGNHAIEILDAVRHDLKHNLSLGA